MWYSSVNMSSPEFFDAETHSRLAVEANGGVCSILVSNILIQSQNLSVNGRVGEVYSPDTKDFAQLPTDQGKPTLRERFLGGRQTDFRPMTEVIMLDSGLSVDLGFYEEPPNGRGDMHYARKATLAARLTGNIVLPIAEFYDMRQTKAAFDDNELGPLRCSYAVMRGGYQAYSENVITTTQDEKEVVLAERDSRGLVFAQDMLELVQQLQVTGDDEESEKKLFEYLSIKDVVAEALNLEPGRDYGRELRLRKRLGELVATMQYSGTTFLLKSEKRDGTDGPSTNRVEETWLQLDNEGHRSLYTNYRYPEAFNTEPREVLRLRIGNRIGQMALVHCVDADKTAEQVVGHYHNILSTPLPGKTEQVPEAKPAVDKQCSIKARWGHYRSNLKGLNTPNYLIDQLDREMDLGPADFANIQNISAALKNILPTWQGVEQTLVCLPVGRGKQRLFMTTQRCVADIKKNDLTIANVPIMLPDGLAHKRDKHTSRIYDSVLQKPVNLSIIPEKAGKRYRQLIELAINTNNNKSPQEYEDLSDLKICTGYDRFINKFGYLLFSNNGDGRLVRSKTYASYSSSRRVLPLIEVPTAKTHAWGRDGELKRL